MLVFETALGEKLQKVRLLSEAVAWFDVNIRPDTKEFVINLIQTEQLQRKGVDSNNEIIGRYSYVTELISKGKKEQGDHFTLKDTGAFYNSMFVMVLKDTIFVEATSSTYGLMQSQDWWREEILGLNEESLEKYTKVLKEGYIKYVRKVLEIN